jgi:hypothetical protein
MLLVWLLRLVDLGPGEQLQRRFWYSVPPLFVAGFFCYTL